MKIHLKQIISVILIVLISNIYAEKRKKKNKNPLAGIVLNLAIGAVSMIGKIIVAEALGVKIDTPGSEGYDPGLGPGILDDWGSFLERSKKDKKLKVSKIKNGPFAGCITVNDPAQRELIKTKFIESFRIIYKAETKEDIKKGYAKFIETLNLPENHNLKSLLEDCVSRVSGIPKEKVDSTLSPTVVPSLDVADIKNKNKEMKKELKENKLL